MASEKLHKGLYNYTVSESNNLKIGQNGFKELASAGNTGDGQFIAFYVIGAEAGDTCVIEATCHQGDDLTSTTFMAGELVYGAFKKITMSSPSDGDVHVLCYYG
tara:strand:- start:20 stop:331 length:312 start_codon:yes stop_codon:yes gene_type:complete